MEKQLPKNWVECSLNDVFEIVTGNTPSKSFPEYYGGNIPWVKPGDINKSIEIYETQEFLSNLGFEKSRKIAKGSVMVTCIGNLGNIAIAGTELATNQQINSIVISHNLINKKYVYYRALTFKKWLVENSTSTTISMVNKSNFEKLPFLLPPLQEQNRIVEKLDNMFNQLETIKASMANIPLLLKDFRQQVLTQAVTGKLTSEWRKGKELESAEVLIQKIIQQRIQDFDLKCKLAKEKGERKPTKVLLDKLPKIERIDVDLPEKWFQTNVHFLSFVTKLAGFEYSLHFDLKEEGEIPVVRAQNVQMGRFEDKNRLYMSKETSDFLVRSQLHGREILMVFIGAGTGNVCLAPKDERWHLAPNVAKIDVDGISTEYLYLYLQSALGIENVLSRVKATAQPSLSMETIRDIVALVPPLEEQYEIVSRVENLFAKSEAIKKQYNLLKNKIDKIPQALLHKAFKGELTGQLESDGDAKELLKAIADLKNIKVTKPKAYKVPKEKLRLVAEPK